MRPIIFSICLLTAINAVCAAEEDFFDPEVLRHGSSKAGERKPVRLAAQYLESYGPAEAAERLLAAEQAGETDHEAAEVVHAEIKTQLARNAYRRAKFISDQLWQAWGQDRYNAFWLDQAAQMLARYQLAAAEKALRHLRKPWTHEHGVRRYSLWGRLYIKRGDYVDAVTTLDKQPMVQGDGLFDHYNFGIALLETGNRDRGLALIDEVGYLPMESEEHRVLRDRVNLSMGWYWLASDQGGTAREYFRRVRLEGPYSNMALLGLGWAELTADGEPQQASFERRVLCEKPEIPPDVIMRLLSDRYAACHPGEKPGVFETTHDFAFDTAEHGAGRYQEALRPWSVLAGRDASNPAVQEALLAVGFAQQERGALGEAELAYRQAIRRYEAETERLDALNTALRTGSDPVAVMQGRALPEEFAGLRSGHDFVQALEQLEALQATDHRLASAAVRLDRLPPDAQARHFQRLQQLARDMTDTRDALYGKLRQWLLDDVVERRERLDLYHSRARLALAQLYDSAAKP